MNDEQDEQQVFQQNVQPEIGHEIMYYRTILNEINRQLQLDHLLSFSAVTNFPPHPRGLMNVPQQAIDNEPQVLLSPWIPYILYGLFQEQKNIHPPDALANFPFFGLFLPQILHMIIAYQQVFPLDPPGYLVGDFRDDFVFFTECATQRFLDTKYILVEQPDIFEGDMNGLFMLLPIQEYDENDELVLNALMTEAENLTIQLMLRSILNLRDLQFENGFSFFREFWPRFCDLGNVIQKVLFRIRDVMFPEGKLTAELYMSRILGSQEDLHLWITQYSDKILQDLSVCLPIGHQD